MSTTESSGSWRPASDPSTISRIRSDIFRTSLVQRERRGLLGEQQRVADHPRLPADDTRDEVEDARRVVASEQDREPGDDEGEVRRDRQEVEDDEVRDGHEALEEHPPARD